MVATDSVNEAMGTVVIKINDVNDKPPVFDRTIYTAELQEEYVLDLPRQLIQVKTWQLINKRGLGLLRLPRELMIKGGICTRRT